MFRWYLHTLGAVVALVTLVSVGTAKTPVQTNETTCSGDFGTSIQFLDTPQDAAREAKKDGRLVFVLHVSGHFEQPQFT